MKSMDCFLKDDNILVATRAFVSARLAKAGFPQEKIARALGCSQAMVSKYLKSPPSLANKSLLKEMEELSENMVWLMKEGVREEGMLYYFCEHFFEWRRRGLICNLCAQGTFSVSILEKERERKMALKDLTEACEFISQNSEFARLVPQVRMNMACCTKNPSSKSDIASIPGRLVCIGDRIFPVAPPEFGTSSHLAELLLKVIKINPKVKSVMNVRLGKDVLRAAERMGLPLTYSEKNVKTLLADKGGFGKEPCLYIFSPSPMEAADVALALAKNLK